MTLLLLVAMAVADPGRVRLESPAFSNGGAIPVDFTCEGRDVSPPLTWSEGPRGTESWAIYVHDPDARDFVHWVVWNLPASLHEAKEGLIRNTGEHGTNGFGSLGWRGPCPPRRGGAHRYVFELIALDTRLDVPPNSGWPAVERAMRGHVLDRWQLEGTYDR